MKYSDFLRLVMDASEFEDQDDYIAEVGGSVPECVSDDKLILLLNACWEYAHDRTVAMVRRMTDMGRAEFAREYRLPLRSVENWEAETRNAPGYVVDLLAWAVVVDMLE